MRITACEIDGCRFTPSTWFGPRGVDFLLRCHVRRVHGMLTAYDAEGQLWWVDPEIARWNLR